jgi:hypothetical protein
MGGGTQTQMLMQRSMTYPAKEEIGIETVAVPGSHPTRSVRQSPSRAACRRAEIEILWHR